MATYIAQSLNWARIMYHQPQLADLVDVIAVDFDIVDTTGLRRRLEAGGNP